MHDMNKPLTNWMPHYTNSHFKHARTIWGEEKKGIGYNYSDRLVEWDYEASKKAVEIANKKAKQQTAKWAQEYLSAYHGKKVKLYHIMAGHNWSNGYPYRVYGYEIIK